MTNRKLNIGVFTFDFFPIFGGQGRHVYEIYMQNTIFNKANMYIFSPLQNELENSIQVHPETRTGKLKNIMLAYKLNSDYEKIIDAYNLDIIHIQGGPGGIFLLHQLSKPIIYTCHHTYWQQFQYINSQKWKYIFYFLEKKSYHRAKRIICVSRDSMNILNSHYNISNELLNYIPNGINLGNFKPVKRLPNTKEIIYVGRIDKRKGLGFLIESLKLTRNIDPAIKLHVIGEGKDRIEYEQYCIKHNLSVKFYGYLQDQQLESIYRHASVQVVPSIFEGFGLSVLEGMARKLPIIATNVDGIKNIITNNYNGKLVEYGNKNQLSKTILEVLSDTSLSKKLVDNAYRDLKKYDWERIYFQTLNLYEDIVS